MSRRTQRASKYIFSTLAQLSENFIFVYLGMSLFTSAPLSEPVFSYVKPVFIIITLIAVIFTRYAAVFPLSEAINLFQRHARGQRHEELPHSYQMMLFWAGLRGAVGVALAAGFKGPNAQMMRTTVLIVVVLTVLLFGGTTLKMLEVMGIRTGVEDDTGFSSDEDDHFTPPTRSAWSPAGDRGGGNGNGRFGRLADSSETSTALAGASRAGAGRVGIHYALNPYNHHHQNTLPPIQTQHNQNVPKPPFSAASSDSYDSDVGEVLPLAPTAFNNNNNNSHPPPQAGASNAQNPSSVSQTQLGEDGKWFQTIDERYLLPIFSNATASRTFHARRARRSTTGLAGSNAGSAIQTPVDSEDEVDLTRQDVDIGQPGGPANSVRQPSGMSRSISGDESRIERGLPSPVMRTNGGNGNSPDRSRFS